MIFALVEWLLLSQCQLILHSHGSSYAAEASLVRRIPLVSLWSTSAIFSLNPSLPFCGHLHFWKTSLQTDSNSGGRSGDLYLYEEGSADRRKVVGKLLELVSCPLLSEWGVLRLFCLWGED
jgi:hypothetical protein